MTSCGLNGGPLKAQGTYSAAICCVLYPASGTGKITQLKRVKNHPMITQDRPDGDTAAKQYITHIGKGGVIGYKYFSFSGNTTLSLRFRGDGTGAFSVWQHKPDDRAKPVGMIPVSPASEWRIASQKLPFVPGVSPLFLRYEGEKSVKLLEVTFGC